MKNKRLKKRGLSLLLAAVFAVLPISDTRVSAEDVFYKFPVIKARTKPEQKILLEEEDVPVYTLKKEGGVSPSGYQATVWVDEDGNKIEGESAYEEPEKRRKASQTRAFPSDYSMLEQGELPAVRSQGQWGTCWAHAALSSMETNMIKKGYSSAADTDYSERHLSYFAHRRNERLSDGEDKQDPVYGWYGGGNHFQATAVLANWYGAASESEYPYAAYDVMPDLPESARTSCVSRLTDASILHMPEDIKQAVMETGAVMCSFYTGDGTVGTAQEMVYHADEHTTDHAVSIVGWDDHFDKMNFDDNGRKPNADGAWKCRNSWGSNWGEDGYFWISYEDATLDSFCSFQAEPADHYDRIDAYDGADVNSLIGYDTSANLFTAPQIQELKAVSFRAFKNYDYRIEVYAEGDGTMQRPSDGRIVYSQSGSLSYPGYHTVPLDRGVVLDSGMRYAVAVCLTAKEGEEVRTYFESVTFEENKEKYSSEPGQSFFYTGREWKDTGELNADYRNVCIKAFSDRIDHVDRSRLLEVIDEAQRLTESDYTVSTWERFLEELAKARELSQSQSLSESEILHAVLDLSAAMEALVVSHVTISDQEEWNAFVKSAAFGNSYEGQTVTLLCDLDLTGTLHRAIGNPAVPFLGTFDGGGHSIANLTYEYAYSYGGLFGNIGESGVVKHVNLTEPDLTCRHNFSGGIAGNNEGTIRECRITGGKLSFGNVWTGGIAGNNAGSISDCRIDGTILFDGGGSGMGGIAGHNTGRIEHCVMDAAVTFQNQKDADVFTGGITGESYGTISKCTVTGELISDGMASTGGITGYSGKGSFVLLCANHAVIRGTPAEHTRTAGIGVCLYGTTSGCYNYGKLLRRAGDEAGAVYCYLSNGSISNCYYLDTSSLKGGHVPSFSAGSRTKEEFASGQAAYDLNTGGGTLEHTYTWSQENGLPVLADDNHRAVVKITVSQKRDNMFPVSVHGITDGVFYEKAGAETEVCIVGEKEGYRLSAEVTGFTPSDREGWYLLPEQDTEAIAVCRKERVLYPVTYHLNRGNATDVGEYHVEETVILPTPVRGNVKFLGWYDNPGYTGNPVREIPAGSTGAREYWAKWESDGFAVLFPQKAGYKVTSVKGYENGTIPEGGSYLFTIAVSEGYETSGLTVRVGETVLEAADSVYRIDHIMSDIEDISVEGIRLSGGHYAKKSDGGIKEGQAYFVPVFPAVGIKLADDERFSESITVDTDEEIRIVTCDADGITSDPELCEIDRVRVILPLPVLKPFTVPSSGQTSAGIDVLGGRVLPTEGVLQVNGTNISYRIVWNPDLSMDLTKIGTTAEFAGTVLFLDVPDWAVIPDSLTITVNVTVVKAGEGPEENSGGLTTQKPKFEQGVKEMTDSGWYQVIDAKKKTAALVGVKNKKITKLKIPATVKIRGVSCKVTEIGNQAAANAGKLKTVILGRHVAVIGTRAFFNCKNLKTLQCKGTALKKIKSGAFRKTGNTLTVTVKKRNRKQKAALWKKLKKAGISKKAKLK